MGPRELGPRCSPSIIAEEACDGTPSGEVELGGATGVFCRARPIARACWDGTLSRGTLRPRPSGGLSLGGTTLCSDGRGPPRGEKGDLLSRVEGSSICLGSALTGGRVTADNDRGLDSGRGIGSRRTALPFPLLRTVPRGICELRSSWFLMVVAFPLV